MNIKHRSARPFLPFYSLSCPSQPQPESPEHPRDPEQRPSSCSCSCSSSCSCECVQFPVLCPWEMQSAGRTLPSCAAQTWHKPLVLIPWFESQFFLIWAQVTVLSTRRWQCECYSLKWGPCSNHTEMYKSKSPKWFLGLVLRSLVTQPPWNNNGTTLVKIPFFIIIFLQTH